MKKKTLYICSEFSEGMFPYAVSIIDSLNSKVSYALFVSGKNGRYNEVFDTNSGNYFFIKYPNSSFGRKIFRLFPLYAFMEILKICKKHNIKNIHFLTQDTIFIFFMGILLKKYTVYYTVHDFKNHELKYSGLIHYLTSNIA